jgi:hypothetical protein
MQSLQIYSGSIVPCPESWSHETPYDEEKRWRCVADIFRLHIPSLTAISRAQAIGTRRRLQLPYGYAALHS